MHRVPEIQAVARHRRLVQPELVADMGDGGRVGVLPRRQLGGVAGREEGDKERDGADGPDREQGQPDALESGNGA